MNSGVIGYPGPAPQGRWRVEATITNIPNGAAFGSGQPTLNRLGFAAFERIPVGARVVAVIVSFAGTVANSTARWGVYAAPSGLPEVLTFPGGVVTDIGGAGQVRQFAQFDVPTDPFYIGVVGQVASPNIRRAAQNVMANPRGVNAITSLVNMPQINNSPGGFYFNGTVSGELPAYIPWTSINSGPDNAFTPMIGIQVEW